MKCNECEMLSINGVATHEHGCPNGKNHRWDEDAQDWVKTYICRECGYDCDEGDECGCCDYDDDADEVQS